MQKKATAIELFCMRIPTQNEK